jgi:hypothetical protein
MYHRCTDAFHGSTGLRHLRLIALLSGVLLAGCDAGPAMHNATRFVARVSCSCVFVSGRELASCIGDLPDEAALIPVSVDGAAQRVTAHLLWVQESARFEEGRGCRLLD